MGERKKIMVAIDESDVSHYALEWALNVLKPTINSPLLLFHAQPLPSFSYVYAGYGAAPTELIQSVQEHQTNVTKALLERAKEISAREGVVAETLTESGDPKDVICAAVEKFGVELLVLGSRGLGALQRTLLGSVSNYCVHHAKCPVLVVKKPA
ncbi:unnamed protein product [Victoria cruziana]